MDLLILHVEPLLLKYRVNLGFYGHNHVVQRHSAVYNKKVIQRSVPVQTEDGIVNTFTNPGATVHMVIGTAGAGFSKNANNPSPEWNEMFFYKWGYARLTALNSTNLAWEWVESESGIVFDRMAISQITDFESNPHWVVHEEHSWEHFWEHSWEHSIRNFFLRYGLITLAVVLITLLSVGSVLLFVKIFFHTHSSSFSSSSFLSSSFFSSSNRSAGSDVYRKLPSPEQGLDRMYLNELDNSGHSESVMEGGEREAQAQVPGPGPESDSEIRASLVENII